MAKWANALVLDGGPDLLRTRAGTADRIKMHVLNTYADGDSFATATAASLGNVSLTAADITTGGGALDSRVTTIAAKQLGITADAVAPDLHIALIDHTANVVLLVTDETTNAALTTGNLFNVPAWAYTINQPT